MNLLCKQFQDCFAIAILALFHLIDEEKIVNFRQVVNASRDYWLESLVKSVQKNDRFVRFNIRIIRFVEFFQSCDMCLAKATRVIIQRCANSKQIYQMWHQFIDESFENAIKYVVEFWRIVRFTSFDRLSNFVLRDEKCRFWDEIRIIKIRHVEEIDLCRV